MKVYVLVSNEDIIAVYDDEEQARKQAVKEYEKVSHRSWESTLIEDVDLADKNLTLYDCIDDALYEYDIRVVEVQFFERG